MMNITFSLGRQRAAFNYSSGVRDMVLVNFHSFLFRIVLVANELMMEVD